MASSLLLAASCASTPTSDPRAEVVAAVRDLYARLNARDWDGFASRFQEGAAVTVVSRGRESTFPVATFIDLSRRAVSGSEGFHEALKQVDATADAEHGTAWTVFEGVDGKRRWSGMDLMRFVKAPDGWRIESVRIVLD